MKTQTLIVITGPTGVGKTELVLHIAERLGVPIINADSRQIYKELPIGTAAPSAEQLERVRHYFVGTHHITDYFSASLFEKEVLDIMSNNPESSFILSGGSMMYIDAVCNGIDEMPTIDDKIRNKLMERFETEGLESLCDELKQIDHKHWEIVDRKNPRSGNPCFGNLSSIRKNLYFIPAEKNKERPFKIIKIGLNKTRGELYKRINQRTIEMIQNGLIDEAMKVYPFKHLNSLNTVGYKEIFEYLDGLTTLDEAIFKIQSNTRKYARKQLTWFKKDNSLRWFDPSNVEEILNYIINAIALIPN